MNDEAGTACPRCGHPEVAGTRFCTECGTSLAAPAPAPPSAPTATTCPRCGAPSGPGLAFCTHCGQPLAAQPAAPPAAQPGPPACATCGAVLSPGLRFCTSCGTPVGGSTAAAPAAPAAPPAAPATPLPPAAQYASPERRAWPWVLAALVLLVAVAGGGYVLLTRDDGDSSNVAKDRPSAGDDTASDDTPDDSPDDTSDEPDDPADDPTPGVDAPSASPTAAPPVTSGAICWDGTTATAVERCSRPQGAAGLSFVFPSLAGQDCAPVTGAAGGRKLLIQCFDNLPDGTSIRINYSQWASVSAATDHYQDKGMYLTEANGLYFLNGVTDAGELNTAWIYKKEPYSVSVYAPDQTSLDLALTTLVGGRAPDEVRGTAD